MSFTRRSANPLVPRHDTEEEALLRAAAYEGGLYAEAAQRPELTP